MFAALYLYPKRNKRPLDEYKQKAKKYSGLSPDKYSEFVNNLELSEQTLYSVTLSTKYLYKAIDALQDLPLYAKGGSSGLIEEIHEMASSIGDAMERQIAKTALDQGVRFNPRYIKGIQDQKQEVLKKAIPTNGPWYQNAKTGFWTESDETGWVTLNNGDEMVTAIKGPWASQLDPVETPIKKPKWTQLISKPFIDTVHNISRVMVPQSA